MILDAFGDFFEQPQIIVPIVQFSIRVTHQVIRKVLQDKMTSVIQLFNLNINEQTESDLHNLLKPFLKNNYKQIFKDETLISHCINEFDSLISSEYFTFDEQEQIKESIECNQKSILDYFASLKDLIIYMQINDPQITIDEIELPFSSQDTNKFKFYRYQADQFLIVDGFEKENNPTLIILQAPKINNGSFAGIKPTALILNKIPQPFNQTLFDYEKPLSGIRSQSQLPDVFKNDESPIVKNQKHITNVQVFKINRDIIHTPKSTKSFSINLENQKQSTTVSQITPLVEVNLPTKSSLAHSAIQQCKIPIIQNQIDEQEESDDNLDRDINETEHDILLELNQGRKLRNPIGRSTPTIVKSKKESMICTPQIQEVPYQQQTQRPFQDKRMSRTSSSNNIASSNQRSFDKIFTNVHGAQNSNTQSNSKNSKNRKQKNQSLYEDLYLLEQSQGCQQSRFIQCSLNFSKYLRNIVSISPNSKRKEEQRILKFIETKQQNYKPSPSKQSPKITEQSLNDKNYESIKSAKESNKKNRNDILSMEHAKPSSNEKSGNSIYKDTKTQKIRNISVTKTMVKSNQHHYTQSRQIPQISQQQNIQMRKKSPLQEKILKQGSVLKRKPSNPPQVHQKENGDIQVHNFVIQGIFRQQVKESNNVRKGGMSRGSVTGALISPKAGQSTGGSSTGNSGTNKLNTKKQQ